MFPVERKPPEKAIIERFAPNTAALETPSVEGDAMGLLRFVCITRPDAESPAPAITAARTRGMRMFQMMRLLAELPFLTSAAKASPRDMFDEPTNRHTNAITMTAASITATTVFFRLRRCGAMSFFMCTQFSD